MNEVTYTCLFDSIDYELTARFSQHGNHLSIFINEDNDPDNQVCLNKKDSIDLAKRILNFYNITEI